MAEPNAQDTGQVAQPPPDTATPEVTVTAKRLDAPNQPTQSDIDFLKAHPDGADQFKEHFGSLPPDWPAPDKAPVPTQDDIAFLKAHPDGAADFKNHFGMLPEGLGPESTWGEVGQAASVGIGAGEERIAAGIQEQGGIKSAIVGGITGIINKVTGSNAQDVSSPYSQAKISLNRALFIPDAVEWAKKNNAALTDDPLIQQAAKHVGMRPDQFVAGWRDYVNKNPDELKSYIDDQRSKMQDAAASMQEGAKRREMAGQVEAGNTINTESRAKKLALETAKVAPDIVGAIGLSMIPGGAIPVAGLLATDFGERAYSAGKDAGLSETDAKAYGLLSAAATVVPNVPLSAALSKAPGAGLILQSAIGKALASNVVGRTAGAAVDQTVAMGVMSTLQAAVDKGYVSPDMSLKEALQSIASGALSGTVIGAAAHGFHEGVHRVANGPAPKTPQEIEDQQAHAELMKGDQEAKAKDAEKQAELSSKNAENAPPPNPAAEANEAGLRALMAGEKLDPKVMQNLQAQGLITVGKKTGQPMVLPAGRRALAEFEANRSQATTGEAKPATGGGEDTEETKTRTLRAGAENAPADVHPDQALGAAAALGGEEADNATRAPRTPPEGEDAAGAEARRAQAHEQAETQAQGARAADTERAYADRQAQEETRKGRDYTEAKNQVAEETLEQAPHYGDVTPSRMVTMKDAMDVTNKRAADIAATIPRQSGLSPEEREMENSFVNKIASNPQAAFDEYARIPDTLGGKIIGADNARLLSDDYKKDPSAGQAIHEPASWVANVLYRRALAQPPKPGEDNLVLLTAGAPGSGKSTTLDRAGPMTRRAQVIYDAVLATPESAIEKVQAARDAGKDVSMAYVYQNPHENFRDTLLRAEEMGRTVPADFQLAAHEGSPIAVKAVMDKFKDDPKVSIIGIDNSNGESKASAVPIEELLQKNERITKGEMRSIAKDLLNEGKISPEIYERTLGEKPTSSRGEDKNDRRGAGADAKSEYGGPEGGKENPRALNDEEKAKLARAESRARRRVAEERVKEHALISDEKAGPWTRIADAIPNAVWEDWLSKSYDNGVSARVGSKEFLEKVISAASGKGQDPRFKALATALHKYAPDVSIDFPDQIKDRFGKAVPDEVHGLFIPGGDPLGSRIQVMRGLDRNQITRAVLHELVHAATAYEYERNSRGPFAARMNALLAEARELVGQRYGYELLGQHIDYYSGAGERPENFVPEMYGLLNVHEFMAESMSSDRFQSMLAEVAPPERMNSGAGPHTIFKKFVQIVRDFLSKGGIGINSSLVEDVVSTTGEVMRAQAKRYDANKATRDELTLDPNGMALKGEDKDKLGSDVARDVLTNRMTKLVTSASELGALKMARGISRFEDWKDAMTQELGNGVKPVLEQLYQMAKDKMVDVRGLIYKTTGKGDIVGGPQGGFKQADVAPLRAQLRKLAREGEFGKDWYKESSDALVQSVGGNKQDAKRLAGLFSIFSTGAAVDANTTMALRAWYQYKAGEPIKVGTTEVDKIAQQWLNTGKEPTGMKRSNFYGNLLQSLEGDTQRMYSSGVTVDRWMLRALGYTREAPTDAQYAFVADQIRRVSKSLKWTPEQVQAAVWVSIKARWEAVRSEVMPQAIKKGWVEPGATSKGGTKVNDPERYYGAMLDKALKASISDVQIAKAATNFRDSLLKHRAQVSWEAMPGVGSGRLRGAADLPVEALESFQRDVSAAHADPATGNDQLQEALGLLSQGRVNGNSAWFRDPGQVMRFRHWGPDGLTHLDPAKQGTGSAGGIAERNRQTKVTALYPYDLNAGHQPEPYVAAGRHEYVAEVPAEKLYDASRDPRGYKDAAQEPVTFNGDGEPTAFAYSHDAFEQMVKDAGFTGYYVSDPSDKLMHGQARLFEPVRATPADKYVSPPVDTYVKAGAQDVLYAPLEKGSAQKVNAGLDPNARMAMESYAAAMGKVNNQDSVGWHRPRFGAALRDGNGLDVKLKDTDGADFQRAYKAVYDAVRAEGVTDAKAAEFAPVQTPEGMRFLNWGVLDNRRFQQVTGDALRQVFGGRNPEVTHFAADGGLIHARDYDTIIAGNGHTKLLAGPIADVGRRVESVYREFANRNGLQDPARSSAKRAGEERKVAAPVPLDQLNGKVGGLGANIMSRFGEAGAHDPQAMRLYPIKPEEHLQPALDLAKRMGYGIEYFSFVSDPSRGIEFRIPTLGKRGYDGGKLWIYDPRIDHGSFHDADYTRVWRVAHEMGHAVTEPFMQSRYGDSYRYGALGRDTMQTRGTLGKQKDIPSRGLTLAEAQRAIEWEDTAFRAQRIIMSKLGIEISDADFAREYNLNMADAMARTITGNFTDPALIPSDKMVSVKDVLTALAGTEGLLAKDQGREPTAGYDLNSWRPVSDGEIRQAIETKQHSGSDVKFSVRPEETVDHRIVATDRDGNEVTGPHSDLQFANEDDAAEHALSLPQGRGLKYTVEPVSRDPYKNQLAAGKGSPGASGRFLKEFAEHYPETGVGERLVNGNVAMGIVNDPINDKLAYVSYVRSLTPGQGEGTRAMRDMVGLADKHGVALELNAVPLDAKGLPNEKLIEWYKKLGFKDVDSNIEVDGKQVSTQLMRREPQEKPEAVPVYQTNAGKGISVEDAAKVIEHAKRMFPGAQHHLLESIEDAPHEVQAIAEVRGVTDRVQAVYTRDYDGTHTYLIRNNTTSVEDALHTMIEENVGHDGISKTFGPKVGALMDGFLRNDRLRASIAKMADREGINLAAAKDPLERREAWRAAAEEWLAHAAGVNPDKWTGLQRSSLGAVLSEMKVWAASHGLPITLNQADALTALSRARRYVSTGAWTGRVTEQREAAEASKVTDLNKFRQEREDAADLKTFHDTLMSSVRDRMAQMQQRIDAVPHKYAVGDRVTSEQGNVWKITGLDVTKHSPEHVANIKAGIGFSKEARASAVMSPRRTRYKASAVLRNNAPTVYGVFDVSDKSQGFNGRLVSEHETLEAAQTDATALNSVQSKEAGPDLPAYRVESLDGATKTSMAEWGIKDKFAGPKAVKFSVKPTGNADLDELLNDKIGAPKIGWRTRLQAAVTDIRSRMVTSGLDRMNRVKEYEDDMKVPAAESGYMAMRLSTNVAPLLRNLIEFGHLKWTDTAGFDPDKSMVSDYKEGKPLNTVLAPLHNDPDMLRRFEGYLVALRSKELAGQGRENLLEQRHIQAGLDQATQYPHFVQMQRDLAALNKNVLDFAEKAGIIDPEARRMWESDYYVPFYRVTDDAGAGPWSAGSLAKVRNPIMRLMGGKENLNDITGNIVRNWSTLINSSLKAHAVRVAVDNLAAAGVAVRVPALELGRDALVSTSEINKLLSQHGITGALSPSAVGGIQKLMSLSTPQGDDVVQVWRNGKREYYRLADPALAAAFGSMKGSPLKSLRDDPIGRAIVGAATLPKMVLTKLTTENPAFGVRTLWKDNINAWTVGRGMMPVTPVISAITGLARTMKADGAFRRMAAAGATFNAGRADPYDTNLTAQRYIKAPSLVGRLWDGYRNMMLSGENASRVTIYDRTLKETGSHKLAAFEARDLMDYAMRGSSPVVQFFVETVPFWGAHVQGLYKTARAMNPDNSMTYTQMAGQAAKKISALALKGTLLSLAASTLYMHNRQNSAYNDLPDIQKELYYHLYLGNYHIKIPKAFETGTIFGTVPEAITESLVSHLDPQTLKEQGAYIVHAFGAALNLYPRITALTPLYELQTNKDLATGYPILSEHDQGLQPQEQAGPGTSPVVAATARAMPGFAPNALQSPKELQHLIVGYLGIMGSYALNAADFAYRQASGLPASPTRNLNEIPVVGSFVTRSDEPAKSTKSLGELSTVMIAANQLTKTIGDLQKAGDQSSMDRAAKLRRDNMDLMIANAAMKPASDAIHELQTAKRQIQMEPGMSAEDKQKRVNEIQKKIDEVAQGVYEFRPGGKMNRQILDRISSNTPPAAKAQTLRNAGMPSLASISLQYRNGMPPTVQAAIEELG